MKVKKIIKKVIAASMSLALVHTTIAPIPVFAAESNKQFSTINIEDISSSPQSTRATYSKTLSSDLVVGSATITFNAVGYYSGKHWTNASASNASVDSDFVIYTYKLSGQSNKTTCTSSCITLKCSGNLDTYVGVGNVGIVKITSQTYSSKTNFYASSYL